MYLNHAPDFYKVYEMEPGTKRRDLLKKLFHRYPAAKLVLNKKVTSFAKDLDLAELLAQGVISLVRDGLFQLT